MLAPKNHRQNHISKKVETNSVSYLVAKWHQKPLRLKLVVIDD